MNIVLENFYNVPSYSGSKLGDIITYSVSFEDFEFQYGDQKRQHNMDDKDFRDYYETRMKTKTAHYSVVLLKNPSGDNVAYIIQKSGTKPVNLFTFPKQRDNFENGRNFPIMIVNPINPNDPTPIYSR